MADLVGADQLDPAGVDDPDRVRVCLRLRSGLGLVQRRLQLARAAGQGDARLLFAGQRGGLLGEQEQQQAGDQEEEHRIQEHPAEDDTQRAEQQQRDAVHRRTRRLLPPPVRGGQGAQEHRTQHREQGFQVIGGGQRDRGRGHQHDGEQRPPRAWHPEPADDMRRQADAEPERAGDDQQQPQVVERVGIGKQPARGLGQQLPGGEQRDQAEQQRALAIGAAQAGHAEIQDAEQEDPEGDQRRPVGAQDRVRGIGIGADPHGVHRRGQAQHGRMPRDQQDDVVRARPECGARNRDDGIHPPGRFAGGIDAGNAVAADPPAVPPRGAGELAGHEQAQRGRLIQQGRRYGDTRLEPQAVVLRIDLPQAGGPASGRGKIGRRGFAPVRRAGGDRGHVDPLHRLRGRRTHGQAGQAQHEEKQEAGERRHTGRGL